MVIRFHFFVAQGALFQKLKTYPKKGATFLLGAFSDSWFRKKNGPPRGWDGPGWVRAGKLVSFPELSLGVLPICPNGDQIPFFCCPGSRFPKVENPAKKGGPLFCWESFRFLVLSEKWPPQGLERPGLGPGRKVSIFPGILPGSSPDMSKW